MKPKYWHVMSLNKDQVKSINPKVFHEDWVRKQTPVVLKGLGLSWPCLKKWNLDFFNTVYGNYKVSVFSTPGKNLISRQGTRIAPESIELSAFIKKLKHKNAPTLLKCDILQNEDRLRSDVNFSTLVNCSITQTSYLWISPNGSVTPLHYDHSETIIFQICGRKSFLLSPPGGRDKFKAYGWGTEVPHISRLKEDEMLTINANLFYTELSPGDAIYIPSGWWHKVESIGISISVNSWLPAQRLKSRINHLAFIVLNRLARKVKGMY